MIWDLRVGGNSVGMIRGPRLSGDSMDISRDGQMLLTGRDVQTAGIFVSPRVGHFI